MNTPNTPVRVSNYLKPFPTKGTAAPPSLGGAVTAGTQAALHRRAGALPKMPQSRQRGAGPRQNSHCRCRRGSEAHSRERMIEDLFHLPESQFPLYKRGADSSTSRGCEKKRVSHPVVVLIRPRSHLSLRPEMLPRDVCVVVPFLPI